MSDSPEAIQWRNIKKVVREIADYAFGSKDDPSYGHCWLAVVNSLTAKDGIDTKLEPLPNMSPMDADDWAELHRLRAAVKGPEGFDSWQDAAVHERQLRVKMQKEREQDWSDEILASVWAAGAAAERAFQQEMSNFFRGQEHGSMPAYPKNPHK